MRGGQFEKSGDLKMAARKTNDMNQVQPQSSNYQIFKSSNSFLLLHLRAYFLFIATYLLIFV